MSTRGVTARALSLLREYPWPGNVRELEHEMRRLVHLCPDGGVIQSPMLSDAIQAPAASDAMPEADGPDGPSLSLEAHLQRLEDRLIREALRRASGNRSQAAKHLGISRNGLALKMERLGITD